MNSIPEAPIRVTFRWDLDYVFAGSREYLRWKWPPLRTGGVYLLGILAFAVFIRAPLVPILAFSGVWIFTMYRFPSRRRCRTRMLRFGQEAGTAVHSYSQTGVTAEFGTAKTSWGWDWFKGVVKTPSGIILLRNDRSYTWLPTSAFTSAEEVEHLFLLACLKTKSPRAKNGEKK